ncbi:hypothetical protein BGI40_00770 [Snodgrassella communis]|uniref:Uncharacterized protein n=1 Tax=Snodgrassella alvi TaxID=1196083 RepID=A0A2N9XWS5_9NEIS|nr:hypothetical protein BGI29_00330 [Snodgrassella communis]PIT26333.1 hypothetical protein BGI39_10010 [Snodgrassella communis]PIT28867.1 hypothetical protein BGI38_04385 [Snodgrassella communis]PIT37321.1 hypothetical protein BGI40_00770 [Snodgrassella communis]PIT54230.1 hypothetical protein BHC48_00665 [Snodgrassella communis]
MTEPSSTRHYPARDTTTAQNKPTIKQYQTCLLHLAWQVTAVSGAKLLKNTTPLDTFTSNSSA